MRYSLEYFSESVRAEIDMWPVGLRTRYRALTLRMETHGPMLGMPHTRAMGDGLFEIRIKSIEGIGRAFFCTRVGRRIVILHGFIKKSEKTPKGALGLARKRMMEVSHHE